MTARKGSGGRGGDARVDGEDSTAEGGLGGDAVVGDGGDGGDAWIEADRSHGIGGPGGRGGLGPGGKGGDARIVPKGASLEDHLIDESAASVGPRDTWIAIDGKIIALARGGQNGGEGGRGGDAYAVGDDAFVAGGQGGESPQSDGRGGRGGRAFIPDHLSHHFGARRPAHMRWPYYEPVTQPGRGGDGPDTPQYKARRLIVEWIKKRYLARQGLPADEVWWDREVVPLAWINEQLKADGHLWRASVVDDEYEFTDVDC
jgi:hypothetical protein